MELAARFIVLQFSYYPAFYTLMKFGGKAIQYDEMMLSILYKIFELHKSEGFFTWYFYLQIIRRPKKHCAPWFHMSIYITDLIWSEITTSIY